VIAASGRGCRDCGRASYGYVLCADCFHKRLAERVRDLVEELLPNGHYENCGREYRVGSIAGEPGRSLEIAIGGPRSGLWCDHGSDRKGNLFGLIGPIRCRGAGVGEALQWALKWLGQPERQRPPRPLPEHAPSDGAQNRERALKRWEEARRLSRGDWVLRYLLGRAIDFEKVALANGGNLSPALRFHPRLWNAETQRFYPAMVAAIIGPEGQSLAAHRTWLVEDEDGRVIKAPLKSPKKTLGNFTPEGGCIRLLHPNWREATDRDVLAISEGIEDGLTVAQAEGWQP
jgi:hypothetical protein